MIQKEKIDETQSVGCTKITNGKKYLRKEYRPDNLPHKIKEHEIIETVK